jgi:hypothetical protein
VVPAPLVSGAPSVLLSPALALSPPPLSPPPPQFSKVVVMSYCGTDAARIWSNSGCEPTENSGTAVSGISHPKFSAFVSGSIEIWMCTSDSVSPITKITFSPVWSTGIGPGITPSQNVPPHASAASGVIATPATDSTASPLTTRIHA